MFTFFTIIFIGIAALWMYALRRSPDPTEASEQTEPFQNRWIIGGGVVLPVASIIALLVVGIPAGQRMLPLDVAGEDVLQIDVTGHRWWWEVSYPGTNVRLVDELHIPAGTPVNIQLRSADVIHAFWLPRLGGKLDAIPGKTNILRLEADAPGLYYGQCAEFCGLQHALMRLTVEAHAPDDFTAWLQEREVAE